MERDSGTDAGSPVVDRLRRTWAGSGTFPAATSSAQTVRLGPDAVVPVLDRAARVQLAMMADDLRRWDLETRTEYGYWEPGGPGPGMVRVTASGWADASAWRLRGGLAGLSPRGFAQGGHGDGMEPGPLLGVLLEQAVTGSPRTGTAAGVPVSGLESAADAVAQGRRPEPQAEAESAAEASRKAGAEPLAGIPGVPGADGVRRLTGDELLGAISAAQRQANRSEWLELAATAEFARRRYAEEQAAIERGAPVGQRAGEFFCEEVSWATCRSARAAEERVELAVSMSTRLPECGARMAEGALDSYRLLVVHRATADLSTEHARVIDAALAPDAPGLTPEALRKRAWRLTLQLDPAAAAKRKKRGKKNTRVEAFLEESGNGALAGRELDPEDVLAAVAYYDAVAKLLRAGGIPGSLRELRALAFTDRNTGKDPLARIGKDDSDLVPPGRPKVFDAEGSPAGGPDGPDGHGSDAGQQGWNPENLRDTGYRDDEPGHGLDALDDHDDDDDDEGHGDDSGGPVRPSAAANIHLLVPAGTVLGWSTTPGELSKLGPVDAHSARDLVKNAARNPATRWHVTLVDESGQAVAHACARGPKGWDDGIVQSVQTVPAGTGPDDAGPGGRPGRDEQSGQVSRLLDHLGITGFEPIARGGCDHRHRETHYTPSRKLGDLVRARTATCPAPMCNASAVCNDLDHTVAWPEGETDECNLSPPCRHHHRTKQAPGWDLTQVQPGVMRWATPSGRIYETHPSIYDL